MGLRSDRSTSNRAPVLPLVTETGTRAVDVAERSMCVCVNDWFDCGLKAVDSRPHPQLTSSLMPVYDFVK